MKNTMRYILGLMLAALLVAVPAQAAAVKKIVLTSDNTLSLNDAVTGNSVAEVITKAKELDSSFGVYASLTGKKDIYFYLRTPGGSIQAGLEMFEALNGLDRPVHTITSFAASMGFQTVQNLGKRYIVQSGVLMSHRASGGFEGSFGGQKPSPMDSQKNFWEQRLHEMDQKTVERTKGKQTLASYQAQYAPDMWLTGTQAVEQGYADEVVQVQCDSSLAGSTTKTINFMGLVNINYDLDNCPLNSTPMNIRISRIATNKGEMDFAKFQAAGGGYGVDCLIASGTDKTKVCATNTSLNAERIYSLKNEFRNYYMDIKGQVKNFRY
jgi:ATP-dependent Clp protease, protease subunit